MNTFIFATRAPAPQHILLVLLVADIGNLFVRPSNPRRIATVPRFKGPFYVRTSSEQSLYLRDRVVQQYAGELHGNS